MTIDLEQCLVRDGEGLSYSFEIESFRRHCLLHGLDDIGLTLMHVDKIEAFEKQHRIVS